MNIAYEVLPGFILVDFVLGRRGDIAVVVGFCFVFFTAFQNLAASFYRKI